ncbi:MAG: DNA replication/repair protein RecF [Chlorobiaceae bacterium]|nr:DNA replication/repair protein RecF [Chlorobiaceae bacterium]NTV17398.1 DNA replication/repair protein RecF [Chlorobiaceae bacterium]
MRLQCINYENFRNHRFLTFEPGDGITLIHGPNGSGKTSILDGIHYCALTRGLISANDSESLCFSTDYFILNGKFTSSTENNTNVKVLYKKEKEKQVIVNNSEIKPFSRHIGRIPCITFSPSEIVIVNGAPAERRRFIDNAISQTDRRYLDDLLAYRRVLHQRNALLAQVNAKITVHKDMLSLWTENLSHLAASIVYTRMQFISAFLVQFRELFQQLSVHEDPSIHYRCSLGNIRRDTSLEVLYSLFLEKYEETESHEIMREQTMTGPHRDDLLFLFNEKEIKKYASQGQLRTFLIALKLAQHRFYYQTVGEKPICLLDDIFSELDVSHTANIFSVLETYGQAIITSAEKKDYGHVKTISMESLKHNKEI